MSEINWNELKDKAHSNAVKHGFWEGRPSDKHFLCLVISELMEAVNAHRRNKFARVPANRKETIFKVGKINTERNIKIYQVNI